MRAKLAALRGRERSGRVSGNLGRPGGLNGQGVGNDTLEHGRHARPYTPGSSPARNGQMTLGPLRRIREVYCRALTLRSNSVRIGTPPMHKLMVEQNTEFFFWKRDAVDAEGFWKMLGPS